MINGAKSKVVVVDKKVGLFTFHYHRPFAMVKDTPKDNDLTLAVGKSYHANVRVYGLGEEMKTEI
jgi:hypothetical protein